MIDTTLLVKIIGASIGSSVAVVFKPGVDNRLRLVQRFVLGAIIGVIFAPVAIDFFKWKHSPDYWLAAAALCGLLGYLALQLLFSETTSELIKSRIKK